MLVAQLSWEQLERSKEVNKNYLEFLQFDNAFWHKWTKKILSDVQKYLLIIHTYI